LASQTPCREAYDGVTYFGCKRSISKTPDDEDGPRQHAATGGASDYSDQKVANSKPDKAGDEHEVVNDFIIPAQKKEE